MEKVTIELRKFSFSAIVSLNDILNNEEDYRMLSELVELSPTTIQNSNTNLNIRIYSNKELVEIRGEVARIFKQVNEKQVKFSNKQSHIKIRRLTVFKRKYK